MIFKTIIYSYYFAIKDQKNNLLMRPSLVFLYFSHLIQIFFWADIITTENLFYLTHALVPLRGFSTRVWYECWSLSMVKLSSVNWLRLNCELFVIKFRKISCNFWVKRCIYYAQLSKFRSHTSHLMHAKISLIIHEYTCVTYATFCARNILCF